MLRRLVPCLAVVSLLLAGCSSTSEEEALLAREIRDGAAEVDGRTVNSPDTPAPGDDIEAADPAEGLPGSSGEDPSEDPGSTEAPGPDTPVTAPPGPTTVTTAAPTAADCESVPELCVEAGEDLSGQDLSSSVFFDRDVSGVNFTDALLTDTDFSQAVAIGTNFTGADLQDAIIQEADLTGADFTNANLSDAFIFNSTLTRVTWANTTCPDGSNSDDNGGSCIGTF